MLSLLARRFSNHDLRLGKKGAQNLSAVIFGGGSQVAPFFTYLLKPYQTRVTFPLRTAYKWVDHLRTVADYRNFMLWEKLDFNDPAILSKLVENNDVVVNFIGCYQYMRDYDEQYRANVELPMRIAKAAAECPDVKRFIHFSAVGADPQSPSSFLRTKWLGEQEVKKVNPNVTIIRPCVMFSDGDNFVNRYGRMFHWLGYLPIIDEGAELRQPIYAGDVAQAMHNMLHMPETVGKTFELGGPHVYTTKEIIEMVFNKINRVPEVKSFSFSQAQRWLSFMPHFRGLNRWMSLNDLQETKLDLIVKKDALTIDDLYVKPVALPMQMKRLLGDYVANTDESLEDMRFGSHGGHDRGYD